MAPDAAFVSKGDSDAAFGGLIARLTERVSQRIAARYASRHPDMLHRLTETRWRSAEALWPDFAPRIRRSGASGASGIRSKE